MNLETIMHVVRVDGMLVTDRTHSVSGKSYPVLESTDGDLKYAKMFQTYHGAKAKFNKLNKLWPDRWIEIVEIEVQVRGFVHDNQRV